MIAARKRPLFNFILRRWLSRVLRARFHNIYLLEAANLNLLDASRPVIGCVNHTNWWDGFVLYVISHRRLPHDIYLAMDEANLRRYGFFAWMGVFGVDLSDPRASLWGVRYAVRLLRAAARIPRLVWIFVQGKLLDPRLPIEPKPGALFLARKTGAQVLPLVLRYEWLAESRPSIFVQIGKPMSPESTVEELAAVLNGLFARIDPALVPDAPTRGEPLFGTRMSMNKRWDYLVRRALRRRDAFDSQNR